MSLKPARAILGESKPIKDLIALIKKVSGSKTNILIIGESGTGKELVARMIHDLGPLKGAPFVPVNCGAIPENLIESELFGHRRGSFTGAIADKTGLFEVASGGTLFLDEVGELPLSMQVKLLRAIQERSFRKIGGIDDTHVDVRIIAATNRDLEEGIRKGTFREDLYYRLNVILVKTPPLRERRDDIELLCNSFLERYSLKQGKKLRGLEPKALTALMQYGWPGNVRELENVMERAVTLESQTFISLKALPEMIRDGKKEAPAASQQSPSGKPQEAKPGMIQIPGPDFTKGPIGLDEILGNLERTYIQAALEAAHGKKKKAAELLGMTFRSFRYRLKKLGMDSSSDE